MSDYVPSARVKSDTPSICIAGNLAKGKCSYIYNILSDSHNPDLKINLYGVNYEEGDEDEVFIGRDLAHTRSFSDTKAAEIDAQVKMIIDRCYAEARKILEEHMDVLHAGAELLIEKERINREEFEALFEG